MKYRSSEARIAAAVSALHVASDMLRSAALVLDEACAQLRDEINAPTAAEATLSDYVEMRKALDEIAPWLSASLTDRSGPEYRAACERVFAITANTEE